MTTSATWRKSTFSSDQGNCVEVGTDHGATLHIRNSNHPERGFLSLPTAAVATFIAACRSGDLDDLTA